ncbi:sigma 54-interacting transcriptional regulator [Xanthobacter autotrophicus]|uniref:sigma-54-dependent Fis family transcriptional regulator n=1 Tax=Xanthobacter TaxID=279 RepID=UPI0024AB902D|nr:sigma-54-dependent Fis family transcriptional regulator [Xanthobacter autotrophicus]MDI4665624.1 sigma 54-interacting transcriptional regulator [Xanthobacter autotrophicus]
MSNACNWAKDLKSGSLHDRMLARHLHFSPDTGHIQMFDQRMLLMHGFLVAALRRELIERLGQGTARETFTRLGYQQGMADARGLREREGDDLGRLFALGPRLREIEGFVRNQAIERIQFNVQNGEFRGDYYWEFSWEAEAHRAHFGVTSEPACWMMIGYASGFTTLLMGRPILWREIECVAMGHARCRVVGRPLEEWDDAEDDLRFLRMEDFVSPPRSVRPQPRQAGRPGAPPAGALPDLVGASAPFNAVVHKIKRVAATDATVLFLGESGVGKERFTKTLHAISPRAGGPLVSLNCAAIPHDLVEAELFGVEKGAFTGATASRPGRFERAERGTILLDEISSLPLAAQGKLLRVLQEREVERVGGTSVRPVDVRVVAASNRDLRAEVQAGRFREDLFFRLNVFPIEIPPLRERREDIPLLVNIFLRRSTERMGKTIGGLTQRASEALWAYDWPGNVRELENMVERAVILADPGANLDLEHLFSGGETLTGCSTPPSARVPGAVPVALAAELSDDAVAALLAEEGSLEQVETRLLNYALECSKGNVSAAARLLKLRRGQLEYRLKKSRRH